MAELTPNDIDGQIVEDEYEATFILDGTTSPLYKQISLQPKLKNVTSMWLSSYDIRGVPVVGGIPVEQNYFLDIRGLPMRTRVGLQDNPVANAVPMQLTGAWTHKEMKYPIPMSIEDSGVCNNIQFALLNADGSRSVYDKCLISISFRTKSQPTSLGKLIASRPQINNNLATRARPWIR